MSAKPFSESNPIPMLMYHRTTAKNAKRILKEGFNDSIGSYGTDHEFSGVWLSLEPLDINEGAGGDTLLYVVLDCSEDELANFEWVESGKTYREWLIPAAIINLHGRVRKVTEG
jgi:hypothetical protein